MYFHPHSPIAQIKSIYLNLSQFMLVCSSLGSAYKVCSLLQFRVRNTYLTVALALWYNLAQLRCLRHLIMYRQNKSPNRSDLKGLLNVSAAATGVFIVVV